MWLIPELFYSVKVTVLWAEHEGISAQMGSQDMQSPGMFIHSTPEFSGCARARAQGSESLLELCKRLAAPSFLLFTWIFLPSLAFGCNSAQNNLELSAHLRDGESHSHNHNLSLLPSQIRPRCW